MHLHLNSEQYILKLRHICINKKKQTILTPIWDDQQEDNYEFDKSKNYEEFYIIYFFVIKKKTK